MRDLPTGPPDGMNVPLSKWNLMSRAERRAAIRAWRKRRTPQPAIVRDGGADPVAVVSACHEPVHPSLLDTASADQWEPFRPVLNERDARLVETEAGWVEGTHFLRDTP